MKNCQLCEREVGDTTRHHLIPRTLHSNKWFKKRFAREDMHETVDLCRDCHRQIHTFYTPKELGRSYNSLEKLVAEQKLQTFITWLRRGIDKG